MQDKKVLSIERCLAGLLLVAAGLSVFTALFAIFSRAFYPYSVERMEGASLLQVMRILSGRPLYTQPTLDYIPLIYPPIYFYLSALVTKFLGIGFAPLRLVSSLAFCGSLIFIFLGSKDSTKDIFSSVVAASFFAATYPLSGIWFDVARVDSLFVFFCVAAIWFSNRESKWDMVLSSLFWVLAVFTKQTGLIALVCCFAYLAVRDFRKNIFRLVLTGVFGGIGYLVCSILWGKWFSYFVFYLPTLHRSQDNFSDISISLAQLLLPIVFVVLISLIPFFADRDIRSQWGPVRYYGFMTCVLFGLSLLGRLNLGGFTNVYMPAHAMSAIMLGISLGWWQKKHSDNFLLKSAIYLICILQFLTLYFDPRTVIPTSAQAESWSRFVEFLEQQEGDILMPEQNYLLALANKPSFVNQVAIIEIFGEYGDPEIVQSGLLQTEISQALQEQSFSLILLNDFDKAWRLVGNGYTCQSISQTAEQRAFPHVIVEEYQACYPANQRPE